MRGASGTIGRAELLRHLGQIHAIDRFEADRFISGEPLRVLQRASQADAQSLAEKLRALGAVLTVEPSPPEFAMPSDISLMSLDGDGAADEPAPSLSAAAPPPMPAAASPLPAAAPTMPAVPVRDAFSAPPVEQAAMELVQPAVAPKPSHAPAPVIPFEPLDDEEEDEEADDKPIPGKLLQGKLRQQPMVRLFAGLALGLGLGYLLSSPYADRTERRVAQVRAEANLDRYRPTEEAHANAARLDQQADDLASSAFMTTVVIWLGAAGAIVAGWYKLT